MINSAAKPLMPGEQSLPVPFKNILLLSLCISLGCQSSDRVSTVSGVDFRSNIPLSGQLNPSSIDTSLIAFVRFDAQLFNQITQKQKLPWLRKLSSPAKARQAVAPFRFVDSEYNVIGLKNLDQTKRIFLDFNKDLVAKKNGDFCIGFHPFPTDICARVSRELLKNYSRRAANYILAEQALKQFIHNLSQQKESFSTISINLVPILPPIKISKQQVHTNFNSYVGESAIKKGSHYQPILIKENKEIEMTYAEKSKFSNIIHTQLSKKIRQNIFAVVPYKDNPASELIVTSANQFRSKITWERSYNDRYSLESLTPIGAIDVEEFSNVDLVKLSEEEWIGYSRREQSTIPLMVPALIQLKLNSSKHHFGILRLEKQPSSFFHANLWNKSSQSKDGFKVKRIENWGSFDDLNTFFLQAQKKAGSKDPAN